MKQGMDPRYHHETVPQALACEQLLGEFGGGFLPKATDRINRIGGEDWIGRRLDPSVARFRGLGRNSQKNDQVVLTTDRTKGTFDMPHEQMVIADDAI